MHVASGSGIRRREAALDKKPRNPQVWYTKDEKEYRTCRSGKALDSEKTCTRKAPEGHPQ